MRVPPDRPAPTKVDKADVLAVERELFAAAEVDRAVTESWRSIVVRRD